MIDIAKRVHDHTWDLDPIVRSLLDTDFYKLLMAQTVHKRHWDVHVEFSLINRTKSVRLADLIDEGELREQLDHARTLTLRRGEVTWLRGNTFYGKQAMFRPEFIDWFASFKLPEYELSKKDGQYELTFEGPWHEVMMWEVPALAIISELRSRAVLQTMGKFNLQVLYARAMSRVWEKAEALQGIEGLALADFGTRRRHSFLWQDWCVQAMVEGLGDNFGGCSNCLIAQKRDLEAIGTNAHELPMVFSALADNDKTLAQAPYEILANWQKDYDGNLLIILPDTYGTQGFLNNAPDWLAKWTGVRIDSGDPTTAGHMAIEWWKSRDQDPTQKLLIFSDGLDVAKIRELSDEFRGKARLAFGWGTLLTNDFRNLVPDDALAPFSLVCKAVSANGRPTVKLSDNVGKAMGPKDEIERYRRVFDLAAQSDAPIIV